MTNSKVAFAFLLFGMMIAGWTVGWASRPIPSSNHIMLSCYSSKQKRVLDFELSAATLAPMLDRKSHGVWLYLASASDPEQTTTMIITDEFPFGCHVRATRSPK